MSQFDWSITKKVEIVDVPQNGRIYGKMECLPLWLTYIGVKGRTLGKTCGIKVGNTLGENLKGTCLSG
jgi:hypothetical protein